MLYAQSRYDSFLVTGGGGFIGSHLVDLLLEQGSRVVVVDNFSTGRLANLQQHQDNPRLQIIQADIAEYKNICSAFVGTDVVCHLAGLADIVPSIEQPEQYHVVNVSGTLNVLRAAHAAGVKRFIYAASSSCYGIPTVYPTVETALINPLYPYALTKRLGEEYVLHWSKLYKLPAISLRLFNVYGPRSRTTGAYGAVLGIFLKQKIMGAPFTIVGDGTQSRDFVYVADVARAFVAAAQADIGGEVFNVGTGLPQTINYLAELLGGAKEYIPKRPGEPDITHADITKIKQQLRWQPSTSFDQGIRQVIETISAWQDAPLWNRTSIAKATQPWFHFLS